MVSNSEEKQIKKVLDDALEHFASDPVMSARIAEFGSVGLQGRGDLFYTIVRSIIGQQISVVAAESIL